MCATTVGTTACHENDVTTDAPCAEELNSTSDNVLVKAGIAQIEKEEKHIRSKKEKREIEAKLGGISKKVWLHLEENYVYFF